MRTFRTSYKNKNGQTTQSQKWYVEVRDHREAVRRFAAFTDRTQSELLGRQIERLINFRVVGEQPDRQLSDWLEHIPERLRERLVTVGLLDCRWAAAGKLLKDHVKDYEKSLLARGRTKKYVKEIMSILGNVFDQCKFILWSDISASRLERHLDDLRDGGNGISPKTFNYKLKTVKGFARWMVMNRRASESPVAHLVCLNAELDKRHERRALEVDELRRLLETARAAPKRFGMTGHERALLYRLAAETGLRSSELRSLRISSFDLDNCVVGVEATYSKHKKHDTLPLRPDTAAELRSRFANKMPNTPAFNMPHIGRVAKMLRADLADAGIPYVDDAGRYADFHSLRHTTGSLLAASGVHPKVAQSILRHSDINLTMSRYTHVFRGQESEAVAKLPDLSLPSKQKQQAVATGTDGTGNSARNLALLGGKRRILTDSNGQSDRTQPTTESGEIPRFQAKNEDSDAKNGSGEATGEPGFEPGLTDPESVVLPLHYSPTIVRNQPTAGGTPRKTRAPCETWGGIFINTL